VTLRARNDLRYPERGGPLSPFQTRARGVNPLFMVKPLFIMTAAIHNPFQPVRKIGEQGDLRR
jgi:hypothetical protein